MENIARFDFDTHLIPPLTKYNAVMEFVLTKEGEDMIISTNFVFPTKIKDAVGIRDPKIKVSTKHSCPFIMSQTLLFTLSMI